MYCTYITFYRGSQLPPFYIGYSTVDKVRNGYHGTVTSKKYKTIWIIEQRDHPHLFETHILTTHKTIREAKASETKFQKHNNVAKNPLFINQHIQGEKFSCDRTGIPHSEKARDKMSSTQKGHFSTLKGTKLSEDHKNKISKSGKGRKVSDETKIKMSSSRTGMKYQPMTDEAKRNIGIGVKVRYANMTSEERILLSLNQSGEKNGFYGKHHSEETIEKLKNIDKSHFKNSFWWTDDISSVRSSDCPGEGWRKGRPFKSRKSKNQ